MERIDSLFDAFKKNIKFNEDLVYKNVDSEMNNSLIENNIQKLSIYMMNLKNNKDLEFIRL